MKKILIIFLIIIVALVLARNIIAEKAIEFGAKKVVGLDLDIGRVNINPITGVIDIKKIKLSNPVGFEDPLMVDIPEVFVDYKPASLLSGKIQIEDIRLDLKEAYIIKNANNEVNVNSLKTVKKEKTEQKPDKEKKPQEIRIDNLSLKIGKVYYKDYMVPHEPKVKTYNINLDERYTNIEDLNGIIQLIIVKIMAKTALGQLLNVDISDLTGVVRGVTGTATDVLKETTGALKDTTGTLKDTTGELKNLLPFGNKE